MQLPSGQNPSNNNIIEKYCYENEASNCQNYGGLYKWGELMQYSEQEGVQGICPDGWHIPTNAEWSTLVFFLGNDAVGGKMKESGTTHWNSPNTGATNESGFSGLPGGYRKHTGSFSSIGDYGYWWSSTIVSAIQAKTIRLSYNSDNVWKSDQPTPYALSARCIKD